MYMYLVKVSGYADYAVKFNPYECFNVQGYLMTLDKGHIIGYFFSMLFLINYWAT